MKHDGVTTGQCLMPAPPAGAGEARGSRTATSSAPASATAAAAVSPRPSASVNARPAVAASSCPAASAEGRGLAVRRADRLLRQAGRSLHIAV